MSSNEISINVIPYNEVRSISSVMRILFILFNQILPNNQIFSTPLDEGKLYLLPWGNLCCSSVILHILRREYIFMAAYLVQTQI